MNQPPLSLYDFWRLQIGWPMDAKGYVFLARALDEIGKALHGDRWTGTECFIEPPPEVPSAPTERLSDHFRVYKILALHCKNIKLPTTIPRNTKRRPTNIGITQEQWKIAYEINKQQLSAHLNGQLNFSSVQREIIRACEADELKSFHRAVRGGALVPIPSSWWNSEHSWSRFGRCQLDVDDPYKQLITPSSLAWIFLSRESLDRYIASQPGSPKLASGYGHLSPYLLTMLAVSKELQITADNQPKKAVVVEALREAWKGKPLSANLIDAMATLLRQPESQLGRARPQKAAAPSADG